MGGSLGSQMCDKNDTAPSGQNATKFYDSCVHSHTGFKKTVKRPCLQRVPVRGQQVMQDVLGALGCVPGVRVLVVCVGASCRQHLCVRHVQRLRMANTLLNPHFISLQSRFPETVSPCRPSLVHEIDLSRSRQTHDVRRRCA